MVRGMFIASFRDGGTEGASSVDPGAAMGKTETRKGARPIHGPRPGTLVLSAAQDPPFSLKFMPTSKVAAPAPASA